MNGTTPEADEVWRCGFYGSGTTVVSRDAAGLPHLYIYGPSCADEGRSQNNRFAMCHQLRDWLNGEAARPEWLDDMSRTSEQELSGLDGSSITAVGPMIDANPPALHWVTDNRPEASDARARLIDRLTGIARKNAPT